MRVLAPRDLIITRGTLPGPANRSKPGKTVQPGKAEGRRQNAEYRKRRSVWKGPGTAGARAFKGKCDFILNSGPAGAVRSTHGFSGDAAGLRKSPQGYKGRTREMYRRCNGGAREVQRTNTLTTRWQHAITSVSPPQCQIEPSGIPGRISVNWEAWCGFRLSAASIAPSASRRVTTGRPVRPHTCSAAA